MTAPMTVSFGRVLCRLDDIPDGEARGFPAPPGSFMGLFAVRRGPRVFVYVNSCPHIGVPLEPLPDRFLDRKRELIVCAAHGARFKVEDGFCISAPASARCWRRCRCRWWTARSASRRRRGVEAGAARDPSPPSALDTGATALTPFLSVALSGAAATGAGIGLARFAFVPLFPALVGAGWVSGAEAGLLGAAALAGYLPGVALAPRLAARFGTRPGAARRDGGHRRLAAALRHPGRAVLAAALAAAGRAGGRGADVAGGAGRAARRRPRRRGAASGIVIAGVGGGAALGALVLPPLLLGGPVPGWLGLAALAAALWGFAHRRFPEDAGAPAAGCRRRRGGCCWPMRCPGRGWWRRWSISPISRRAASASGCWRAAGRGWSSASVRWRARCWAAARRTGSGRARAVRLWLLVQVAALALALPHHGAALALWRRR
jgi:nitrite reductase/ring-hydroxylating ferredoxin subunit